MHASSGQAAKAAGTKGADAEAAKTSGGVSIAFASDWQSDPCLHGEFSLSGTPPFESRSD